MFDHAPNPTPTKSGDPPTSTDEDTLPTFYLKVQDGFLSWAPIDLELINLPHPWTPRSAAERYCHDPMSTRFYINMFSQPSSRVLHDWIQYQCSHFKIALRDGGVDYQWMITENIPTPPSPPGAGKKLKLGPDEIANFLAEKKAKKEAERKKHRWGLPHGDPDNFVLPEPWR
jgi:hypothetical protein